MSSSTETVGHESDGIPYEPDEFPTMIEKLGEAERVATSKHRKVYDALRDDFIEQVLAPEHTFGGVSSAIIYRRTAKRATKAARAVAEGLQKMISNTNKEIGDLANSEDAFDYGRLQVSNVHRVGETKVLSSQANGSTLPRPERSDAASGHLSAYAKGVSAKQPELLQASDLGAATKGDLSKVANDVQKTSTVAPSANKAEQHLPEGMFKRSDVVLHSEQALRLESPASTTGGKNDSQAHPSQHLRQFPQKRAARAVGQSGPPGKALYQPSSGKQYLVAPTAGDTQKTMARAFEQAQVAKKEFAAGLMQAQEQVRRARSKEGTQEEGKPFPVRQRSRTDTGAGLKDEGRSRRAFAQSEVVIGGQAGTSTDEVTATEEKEVYEKKMAKQAVQELSSEKNPQRGLAGEALQKGERLGEKRGQGKNQMKEEKEGQEAELQTHRVQEKEVREKQVNEKEIHEKVIPGEQLQEQLRQKQVQEKQLQEKQLQEKQVQEKQLQEKQLQEKQLQEKQLQEKQLQEKQLQEKQLQEKQLQEKQLQEKQVQEKQLQEKQVQEKKVQEKQLQEKQVQEKQVQEKQMQEEHMQAKQMQAKQIQERQAGERQTQEKPSLEKPKDETLQNEKRERERKSQEKKTQWTQRCQVQDASIKAARVAEEALRIAHEALVGSGESSFRASGEQCTAPAANLHSGQQNLQAAQRLQSPSASACISQRPQDQQSFSPAGLTSQTRSFERDHTISHSERTIGQQYQVPNQGYTLSGSGQYSKFRSEQPQPRPYTPLAATSQGGDVSQTIQAARPLAVRPGVHPIRPNLPNHSVMLSQKVQLASRTQVPQASIPPSIPPSMPQPAPTFSANPPRVASGATRPAAQMQSPKQVESSLSVPRRTCCNLPASEHPTWWCPVEAAREKQKIIDQQRELVAMTGSGSSSQSRQTDRDTK